MEAPPYRRGGGDALTLTEKGTNTACTGLLPFKRSSSAVIVFLACGVVDELTGAALQAVASSIAAATRLRERQ
jgi:hypothetical protein